MDFILALPFVDLLVVLGAREKGDDNNIKTPIGELIKQINTAFNCPRDSFLPSLP
jgi:hypothetical protein